MTIMLSIENNTVSDDVVSSRSMRLWSLMRCMMSPVMRTSKNEIGKFISLIKKSEISEMLMRDDRCNNIQLRKNSNAVLPKNKNNCANNTK